MQKEGAKLLNGIKTIDFSTTSVEDTIIAEEALQIWINGKPFTVTMRTPGNDLELIRGLFYTEDIYTDSKPLATRIVEYMEAGVPSVINAAIPPALIGPSFYESRSLMSVSSCGICGKKEWSDQKANLIKLENSHQIESILFEDLFEKMKRRQTLFQETGGCHAAACFDCNGNLLVVMEDIGRHNAVDKAIGALLDSDNLDNAMIILVSGRISYEIVSKTYKAKIPFLAAVSSPSSLSIRVADEMGITLLAFCRKNSITCYTHPERILFPKVRIKK